MGLIRTISAVRLIFLYCSYNIYKTVTGSDTYISSYDALLGHHEDEADEDGRAQHADSAHERVGSLRPLAAQACGGRSDYHT